MAHTEPRGQPGARLPITKRKYLLLAALAPLFVAGCILQTLYFLNLSPDIITSCCGALFSVDRQGLASGLNLFGSAAGPSVFAASTRPSSHVDSCS